MDRPVTGPSQGEGGRGRPFSEQFHCEEVVLYPVFIGDTMTICVAVRRYKPVPIRVSGHFR